MNAHQRYYNSDRRFIKTTVYCLINADSVRYLLIFDQWHSILVVHDHTEV